MRSSALALTLALSACSATTTSAPEPAPVTDDSLAAEPRLVRRADVIVEQELRSTTATNLYEAVAQLRPRFLQQRGKTTRQSVEASTVVVYVDGSRVGGIEQLRSIYLNEVREVRHLNGPEASARFGDGHAGGAILVSRKRGG